MKLFPYQQKAVVQIEKWNGRALLALEMGLGKSGISIIWTAAHPAKKPVIVVAPSSLKINWQRELELWLPSPKTLILEGETGSPLGDYRDHYIIINYDILNGWLRFLQAIKPQIIILDECQYCKNLKTKRSKAVIKLAKNTPHIIAISGTPVINRPIEFFNILAILRPNIFNNWWWYVNRYCGVTKRWQYDRKKRKPVSRLDVNGASNLDELNTKLLRNLMLRKLKSEVQKELPEKIVSILPLPITNLRQYEKTLEEPLHPLALIEKLRTTAVRGKMAASLEWITNTLEENKLVVFCCHHETIDILMEKFKDIAVKFTGKESLEDRQKAIDTFQTDPNIKLFVGMLDSEGKPAGVGITLTAASYVAFLELPWSPSVCDQASDRCHRVGQKNQVNVYYLIAQNTIEEDIIELIDKKRKIVSKVLDGKLPEDESILKTLLAKYRKVHSDQQKEKAK